MARNLPYGGDVRLETQRPLTQRQMRRPQHPFQIQLAPFAITPFFIAPVLAGESMKNLMVQARFLSGRLRNRVIGWWLETYFFYCPISILPGADAFRAAVVDPTASWSSLVESQVNLAYYHRHTGKPSWVRQCLEPVVRAYFRAEGEEWNTYTITTTMGGTYPLAGFTGSSWHDSVIAAADVQFGTTPPASGAWSGSEYPVSGREPGTTGEVTDGNMNTWDERWLVYQALRRAKLTKMSYEDYLATQGVQAPVKLRETTTDFKIPELIRYTRDWTYPVQAVEPSDGSVKSLVMWNVADRSSKSRFFAEPGFLLGVCLARPKTYRGRQHSSASDVLLDNTEAWMPAAYDSDPHTSLVQYPSAGADTLIGAGPVYGAQTDYIVDVRDLYLHGDQFTNLNPDLWVNNDTLAGGNHAFSVPNVNLTRNLRYPSEGRIRNLFNVNTSNDQIEADGMVSIGIASRIAKDTTA